MSRAAWGVSAILLVGLLITAAENRRLRRALASPSSGVPGPIVTSAAGHTTTGLSAAGEDAVEAAAQSSAGSAGPQNAGPAAGSGTSAAGSTAPGGPSEAEISARIEAGVADRVEAAVKERMSDQRSEWFNNMRDRTTETVDDFADDAGLSDDERDEMHDIIDTTMEDLITIWQNHAEEEDREAAHAAMREETITIRSQMDGALIELLGEDDATAFQQELRGPLGWQR